MNKSKDVDGASVDPIAIRPCPFCGGSGSLHESDDGWSGFIVCDDCNATGPTFSDFKASNEVSKVKSARFWNCRYNAEDNRDGRIHTRSEKDD